MTKLSVNVNKVAWLRNSREGDTPSVSTFAEIALEAGADGITVHPRPDERHIRASDVEVLHSVLQKPRWADREFNIEGNPKEGAFMEHCRRVRPDQCTLVPDTVGQLTSDHGWDVARHVDFLKDTVAELQGLGCRVSLFIDPVPEAIEAVPLTGADRVELYTEAYAKAFGGPAETATWQQFADTAARARSFGLGLNAGHDLNQTNLPRFLEIPEILEVSIGHALTADALHVGYAQAVQDYLRAMGR